MPRIWLYAQSDLVATQSQLRPIATEYQLENQALVPLTPDTFRDISYPNQSGDVPRHDWGPQAAWLLGFDRLRVPDNALARPQAIDGRVKACDAERNTQDA